MTTDVTMTITYYDSKGDAWCTEPLLLPENASTISHVSIYVSEKECYVARFQVV